jgi:hypothetical protein
MKTLLRTMSLTLVLFSFISASAQLSDREMERLKEKVRNDLKMDEIGDGARVYRTSRHWVLVSFATISSNFKPAQQNRQAQMIASRNAVEFLQGTMNKSTSVYDAYSVDSHSLSEQQGSKVEQENREVDSGTASDIKENSQSVEKEVISDKVVQEAVKNIDGLQPLFKYKGDEGIVYTYYMIISKQSAKKKR